MFFYTAKALWFVMQPSVLVLLTLGSAWLALCKGHQLATRRLLAVAGSICAIAMSPIPNALTLPLEQRFARTALSGDPIAGIIILGGSEDPFIAHARNAHAINEAGERLTEAVAMARQLPQAKIVFSGGSGSLFPGNATQADIVRVMLLDMGVASDRIIMESRSRDTWENAVYTKALLKPQSGQRWLLVTSAWHMPRSIGIFRAADFAVEPWPVDYRTAGWQDAFKFPSSPADGLRRLELVMREYIGLLVYALSGRSSSPFPGPN